VGETESEVMSYDHWKPPNRTRTRIMIHPEDDDEPVGLIAESVPNVLAHKRRQLSHHWAALSELGITVQ
jgi:hypothetical protein